MIKTNIIDPALALSMVRNSEVIAYDTETSGLEHSDYIVGYVITDWEHSVYVPVRHEGGGNIPLPLVFEEELAAAFRDRTRLGLRTVGHHLGFDLRMSSKVGYGGKTTPILLGSPLEDTMINESLIDDTTIGYGLDDCSARHQVTVKKGDELYRALAENFGGLPDRKQMKNFWKMPGDHPKVVDYATGDGVSTLELWRSQQPILDEWNLRRVWQLECDLLPYLARMYSRGVKVDMDYGNSLVGKGGVIEVKLAEAKKVFTPGFNVRSPNEVEALYRANGFGDGDFSRTATGKVSFVEKWLETNEIGKSIIGVRKIEKARDSFIAPLIDTKNFDGRVYPVLHQSKSDEFGVAGARLSCSDPNLQAYPKRDYEIGSLIRPLIVPDFGMIYEFDFQQQEPRLFTHYSGDPALTEGYRTGTMDIHDRAAQQLSLHRDVAKRLGMGMLTMMSVPTLARHMGCSEDDARVMHRAFLADAFPDIKVFQDEAVRLFKQRGWVKSILGRIARMAERKFAYRAVSRIIQNSGGDHMKTAILYLNQYEDAYPDEFQVMLSIHDSGIFQTDDHEKHAPEAKRLMEKVAEDFGLKVPIPVDTGWGKHWGQASYIKRKSWSDIDTQD